MTNYTKAQGKLVAPLNSSLSHLCFDHARSFLLAIPPNRVFEPSIPSSQPDPPFSPSLSMLAPWLTPLALLAGALAVWQLAADSGWTNQFFIANGLLSHWQAWLAVAVGVHISARGLDKWLKIRNSRVSIAAPQPQGY